MTISTEDLQIFNNFLSDCALAGYDHIVIDQKWGCRAMTKEEHKKWCIYLAAKQSLPGSEHDDFIPNSGPKVENIEKFTFFPPAIWLIAEDYKIKGHALQSGCPPNGHQTFLDQQIFPEGTWDLSKINEISVENIPFFSLQDSSSLSKLNENTIQKLVQNAKISIGKLVEDKLHSGEFKSGDTIEVSYKIDFS